MPLELAAFRDAFTNEKVDGLIKALEEVLPERKGSCKILKDRCCPDITGTITVDFREKRRDFYKKMVGDMHSPDHCSRGGIRLS